MDFNELRELIQILEESDLSEIEIDEKGRRIRLQKSIAPAAAPVAAPVAAAVPEVMPVAPEASAVIEDVSVSDSPPDVREAIEAQGLKTIDAPMVGTFYISPAPGEEPFTKIGDQITESQTVCIVEAMKLMNEVVTKFAGIIERVLVENGQPVEFGQPLFAIRPL